MVFIPRLSSLWFLLFFTETRVSARISCVSPFRRGFTRIESESESLGFWTRDWTDRRLLRRVFPRKPRVKLSRDCTDGTVKVDILRENRFLPRRRNFVRHTDAVFTRAHEILNDACA